MSHASVVQSNTTSSGPSNVNNAGTGGSGVGVSVVDVLAGGSGAVVVAGGGVVVTGVAVVVVVAGGAVGTVLVDVSWSPAHAPTIRIVPTAKRISRMYRL